MSKRKGICKCPPHLQKFCKHGKRVDHIDVKEVIEALNYEEEERKKNKPHTLTVPTKFKTKPFKPRHFKDTCVPMKPSMHTRLRYINHCPLEPPDMTRKFVSRNFNSSSDESEELLRTGGKKYKKRVTYYDLMPEDIYMQGPTPVLKHTDSDTFIVKLASPKVSGEVISAEAADVKPGDWKPPLPAKSGHDLFKPHSGIVINQDKSFVPDVVYMPGKLQKQKRKQRKPCHKGGICKDIKCPRRKCRKYHARRVKQRQALALKSFRSGPRSRISRSVISGATDGKPRAKGLSRHVKYDDPICGLDEIPRPEHVPEAEKARRPQKSQERLTKLIVMGFFGQAQMIPQRDIVTQYLDNFALRPPNEPILSAICELCIAFVPPNLKKGMLETHSLTVLPCTKEKINIHYGILIGSFNMYDSKFGPRSRGRQALTMSVMAYCLAFHYHPKQWTAKLIDNLVDSGDAWYLQCLEKVHDHSAVQGMCEVIPFGKKQTLLLNGKKMQVLLGEPDIIGYTMSTDPTVHNLCRGLIAFFKDHRAGILLTRVLKLVIWKDRVCYYIFDPAGRDARAYSNYSNGAAALINVVDLKSVAEVLLSRSILDDQKYVLASLKVLRMIKETADEDFESEPELTQAEKAMLGYRILNENCAIVNANMHLGERCFEEAKYRQALPVAVVAMTYAKISPPNTWFSKTLDKILRLGNKLYHDCVHPKVMIDLTIDNIPNEITLGPYSCEIIIYRERVKGQLFTPKECIFNIKTGLVDFFSHEYNSGILEFSNYSMAVWRQKEMYYLFDPFPRTTEGTRSFKTGRACCWMLLNPESMASVLIQNWDYMPATTQFCIHAFKVLKLRKKQPKTALVCTLSDDNIPHRKKSHRKVLHASKSRGDSREAFHDVMPSKSSASSTIIKDRLTAAEPKIDEEHMGDIVSLVDSIQDYYVPPIPLKYKHMAPDAEMEGVVDLDSPTVSVTQVVPPWPKPRDKSNEPPEPDPSPEPTPPPTPPPPPIPEGGVEEEEEKAEEEEDEETRQERLEEEARKKAEEEEARRKAEELPPPLPPPPPSPQPELAEELAPLDVPFQEPAELEAAEPPGGVDRKILLTEDAKRRFKLRQLRKQMTAPLTETHVHVSPSEELAKPSNFKTLPDGTEIIRGGTGCNENDVLPFSAIMAVVTSYKYNVNSWTKGIVDFLVSGGKQLHAGKKDRFQTAPVHIIPRIGIGKQAYHANIDVIGEGATWEMENMLINKFFPKYDRGVITTYTYSSAFFKKNGLYYLFDGSTCNPMGLREDNGKGTACLLRFRNLHDLIARIMYNKDGTTEDQQFVLSRILVRRLLTQPRYKLPEDYDYSTMEPKSQKSKATLAPTEKPEKMTSLNVEEPKSKTKIGYSLCGGIYRLEGTTALKDRSGSSDIKSCHFVCLMAMLMATMHPIRTWDHTTVDMCIEKGLEIFEKAINLKPCEKRVIRNVIVDGKFININIKKIIVINNNTDKRLEQYIQAVSRRLRYFLIRYPQCSMVVSHTEGYYHLFDPYPPPSGDSGVEDSTNSKTESKKCEPYAAWTLYRSQEALIKRLRNTIAGSTVETPEFYTFELTSIKVAPRHSALNYRLSPLFKPDENPNSPYLRRRRVRPLVDEKMYWLNIEFIPWSRMNLTNDLGFPRKTPRTMWKAWDIEFPGDLYSLWGSVHPLDMKFEEKNRGKQYLATCVVAIVMSQACNLSAWTGSFLDGVVNAGDRYHQKSVSKIGDKENYELNVEDLETSFDDMFPYSFTVKFDKILFGFVYNMLPDRFNLSKALDYFFESRNLGILVSPSKNLAFGRAGKSYFMFDCQSFGAPIFTPGQGSSYMLKCESLNRLVYCITITLNIRRHATQFHLYSVNPTLSEKTK